MGDLYLELVNGNEAIKEYEKAIVQFNKSISVDPTYAYAYSGRAETYLKTGRTENFNRVW